RSPAGCALGTNPRVGYSGRKEQDDRRADWPPDSDRNPEASRDQRQSFQTGTTRRRRRISSELLVAPEDAAEKVSNRRRYRSSRAPLCLSRSSSSRSRQRPLKHGGQVAEQTDSMLVGGPGSSP